MTTTFETVKVGDKVWCIMSGWGEVREIKPWKAYPIVVYFADDEFQTYTVDGLYEADNLNQTLFWDEIVIDAPLKNTSSFALTTANTSKETQNMNQNYENLIKKVKTLKTNLLNADTFLCNLIHGKNLYTRGMPSKNPETKFFGKITAGIQGESGHIDLCDLQERELAHLRELLSLYTRRIEEEKKEGEAKIAAIEELLS